MIPNQIELTLKILNIRGNGYDGVLIGNHNNILASGSISTEAACNPYGWYQLLAIPLTFLEKQLAHLG